MAACPKAARIAATNRGDEGVLTDHDLAPSTKLRATALRCFPVAKYTFSNSRSQTVEKAVAGPVAMGPNMVRQLQARHSVAEEEAK